jgi:hypothetical protein
MSGLHQTLGEVEENTKPGKPNYAEKIELERIAEERIVEDRLRYFQFL